MTLREWFDAYTWNGDAQLVCAWRKRAWRAMRPVVERFLADHEAGIARPAGILLAEIKQARIDAGINAGGKRWRQEYEKLLEALQGQRNFWPPPTQDERDVCMVARDLEESGRADEAAALVHEQAPNAHNRRCGACGRKPGEPCFDVAPNLAYVDRVVPHEARLVG